MQHWKRLEYGFERGYAVIMTVHHDRPDRLFVGVAYNGPPAWAGPKAARTGPFTASRWSRDLFRETGGAHAGLLRSRGSRRNLDTHEQRHHRRKSIHDLRHRHPSAKSRHGVRQLHQWLCVRHGGRRRELARDRLRAGPSLWSSTRPQRIAKQRSWCACRGWWHSLYYHDACREGPNNATKYRSHSHHTLRQSAATRRAGKPAGGGGSRRDSR